MEIRLIPIRDSGNSYPEAVALSSDADGSDDATRLTLDLGVRGKLTLDAGDLMRAMVALRVKP